MQLLYVRCYHDAMCGIANPTSGTPTMTKQSTATLPESPFHSTATTVDSTGATKPTSEPDLNTRGQGSSEQRQSDQTLVITIAVSVGATFVLTLLISTVMFIVISLYCKYCGILDKCTESQEHVHKAEPNVKEQGLFSKLIDNPSTEHQAIPIYDTIVDYEELNTTVSEVSGSRECRDEGVADTVENIAHVAHLQSSNNPQTIKNIPTLTNEAYGVSIDIIHLDRDWKRPRHVGPCSLRYSFRIISVHYVLPSNMSGY